MEIMGIIGLVLFCGCIVTTYNVFFNQKSAEYWESSFWGNKFQAGCVFPLFGMLIAWCLMARNFLPLAYLFAGLVAWFILKAVWKATFTRKDETFSSPSSEKGGFSCLLVLLIILIAIGVTATLSKNQVSDQHIQDVSNKEKNNEQLAAKEREIANKMAEKYNIIVEFDVPQFKKFVNDNYKNILQDKRELVCLRGIIDNDIFARDNENKDLLEELRVIKKMDLTEEERKKKADPIREKGRANNKRVGQLKEFKEYLSQVFDTKPAPQAPKKIEKK